VLRQLVAAQRTILHAPQSEIVEANLSRRFGARIPDRAVNGRTIGVGGNIDQSQAGGLRQRRREAEAAGGKAACERGWKRASTSPRVVQGCLTATSLRHLLDLA
jgi:hypothetical protein